jgi:hypothetical protein
MRAVLLFVFTIVAVGFVVSVWQSAGDPPTPRPRGL